MNITTTDTTVRYGLHTGPDSWTIAVIEDGRIRAVASLRPAAALRDGALVVGDAALAELAKRPGAGHTDLTGPLEGHRSVPLWDTFFPPRHLAAELVSALVAQVGGLPPGAEGALTHPPGRADRAVLLQAAAEAAGLGPATMLVTADAAAWAPADGPGFRAGELLLIFELEVGAATITVLEVGPTGYRPVAHTVRSYEAGGKGIGTAGRALVEDTGHRIADLADARAVGARALDDEIVSNVRRELRGPLLVPAGPEIAVAVGAALHRDGAPPPLAGPHPARLPPVEPEPVAEPPRGGPVLEPSPPGSADARVMAYTYGFALDAPFEDGVDPADRRTIDGYGNARCAGRFASFVQRGSSVPVGTLTEPYLVSPLTPHTAAVGLRVYASPEAEPRYVDSPGTIYVGLLEVDVAGTVGLAQDERQVEVSLRVEGHGIVLLARDARTARELARTFTGTR